MVYYLKATDLKIYFLIFVFLSNLIKSGYKYYTSCSLLKLQFQILPVVYVGSCATYIVHCGNPGIQLLQVELSSSSIYRYLIQKATVDIVG